MEENRPKTLLQVLKYTKCFARGNKGSSKWTQKLVLRLEDQVVVVTLKNAPQPSLSMQHCNKILVCKIFSRLDEIFSVAIGVSSVPDFDKPKVILAVGDDLEDASANADRILNLPDHFVSLHLIFDSSFYSAVITAVFRSLEDMMSFPSIVSWVANGCFKNRRMAYWAQDDEFELLTGGSIAWSFAVPFVGGIVAAARSERCATTESDDVTKLLLDKRLVRTRGNLMSSYRAGLIFSFLPMPHNVKPTG